MEIDISKYKAFFFDFDGVIVDSLGVKAWAFGELFKGYGKSVACGAVNYHRDNGGVSRYKKFKYIYTYLLHKKIDHKIIGRLDRKYSRLVVRKVVGSDFIKGAKNFIRRLKKYGKNCFIISATPEAEMRRIAKLKKVDVFFDAIVGSPKSKSENLKYLCRKYSIEPEKAIYFGDAKSDYLAAKENKIKFIGIVNRESRELRDTRGLSNIRDFLFSRFV